MLMTGANSIREVIAFPKTQSAACALTQALGEVRNAQLRDLHICLREKLFFFSSRRRHTRLTCDWSSDVCSSDLASREAVVVEVIAASVNDFDRAAVDG